MKTLKSTLLVVAFLASGVMFTSCEDTPDDAIEIINVADGNFSYNSAGIWVNNNEPGFLNIDDYVFSHAVPYTNYVTGFTPSKDTNTEERKPYYSYPYASAAGGGINGSAPYLVGYWDSYNEGTDPTFDTRSCRIYNEDGDEFTPQSVMVCCNTYLYYAVLNGTDFSEKFGPGDWVTLTAHGVHMDGTESQAVYYLVNIESNDVEAGITKTWAEFDLTGLGKCTGIYFTMDSNDKGDYGVNVPTYFCIDRLKLED